MLKGKELIKPCLSDIPTLPGVYRMLDKERNIIYIGKAKNLKNRLSQYTLKLSGKTENMVSDLCYLEYSVTESEAAALLLEGQLIKKFKPQYNILLKDDKSFPYIKLRLDHEYPQLLKFRGKNLSNGKFFGPFASVMQVDVTLLELQKIFKLRSCSDNYFSSRQRPCLQYQIKRCCAPCVGKISKEEYDKLVTQVKAFLAGKNNDLQEILASEMQQLSSQMKFEQAAEIRDRIKALSYIQLKSAGSGKPMGDADIIAISEHHDEFCIQLFIYRNNQPCGNQAYFPVHTEQATKSEVLESFLLQLYQNKLPPKNIFISDEIADKSLYEQMLSDLHNIKIKILIPKLGHKYKLIENAIRNAEIALEKHLKTSAKNISLLKEVQKIFALEVVPRRIEVYDNSHIQGSFAVGAMIVAGKEGFDKKEYRLFNIQQKDNSIGGDDYGMLSQVMTRRLVRLKKEPHRTPDLMIIDGGRGHLSTVEKVMSELDIHIPFVCMSKGVDRNSGREQFHISGKPPFTLDKNLPVMKYLQILRDEVHNFAIKSHRSKRSKAISKTSLDNIEGVGLSRKKALLNYFGSFKLIQDATIEELSKVPGISKPLAKVIFDSLH